MDDGRNRALSVMTLLAALAFGFMAVAITTQNTDTPARITPADPAATFNPVSPGADLPDGYRIGFPRDQIAPVYEPVFTTAAAVDWPADSLVIGVAGEQEAKAYPVTHLNLREMVIDSLEGIPILVTW